MFEVENFESVRKCTGAAVGLWLSEAAEVRKQATGRLERAAAGLEVNLMLGVLWDGSWKQLQAGGPKQAMGEMMELQQVGKRAGIGTGPAEAVEFSSFAVEFDTAAVDFVPVTVCSAAAGVQFVADSAVAADFVAVAAGAVVPAAVESAASGSAQFGLALGFPRFFPALPS